MQETKPIRLSKAATELNVSTSTVVEFLQKSGYEVDSKPNTKLSGEMYGVLQKEFRKDINNKEEANQITLGLSNREQIGINTDAVQSPKKKEEGTTVFVKTSLSQPFERKEDEQPVAKEKEPVKEPVVEPKKVEAPKVEKAEEKKAPEPVEEAKPGKLGGPKVVGRIELKDTRKKPTKKATEPKVEAKPAKTEEQPKTAKKEEKPVEKAKPAAKKAEPEAEKKVIRAEAEKLTGPKVLGKIDLSTKENSRDRKKDSSKKGDDAGQKRKRKRIVSPKKVDTNRAIAQQEEQRKRHAEVRKRTNRRTDEEQQVSEKEIEDKIKATMARLAGSANKSSRSKIRRAKRQEAAETHQRELSQVEENLLKVTEFVTVSEIANMMSVSATEVISTCMGLGVFASINQRLDAEVIELVADEFGYKVEFVDVAEESDFIEEDIDDPKDLKERAPIVTIMGHVDHGKTSLLDFIRQADVAGGEAGGITQHIGAYEVITESGKKITFLDTPGHEAFTAMRARGAKITDVAVIVVAADDSVMPQTKEAISHAQSAGVPMIFALNKIDKENANPDRIREQLSQMNILLEDWGGKFQSQELSAKTGLNIDKLLEKILLESELLELKANPDKNGIGSIVEASLDKGRGYVATTLVQAGEMRVGDIIVSGPYHGKVKAMFDHKGKKVKVAGPSTPVQILGLDGAPQAGEKFKIYDTEQEAKTVALRRSQLEREQGLRAQKHITLDEIGRRLALGTFKELNLIIKGDVDGSVEALSDSLLKLSTEEIGVQVIHKGVGQITESDVLLASASDAIIVGFQVRPSLQARKLAETENIEIRKYSIIYNAIEEIKSAMEGMLEPTIEEKITANIEVREVFKITKVGTIAGCYVSDGKISRNSKIRLIRDGIVVYTGELASLKRFKDDAKEVSYGMECGLNIKDFNDIKVGDIVESYEEVEIQRTLD